MASDKGVLSIYLDEGNFTALLVDKESHVYKSGITYKNVEEIVSNGLAMGYEAVYLHEYTFKRAYRECHRKDLPAPKLPKKD